MEEKRWLLKDERRSGPFTAQQLYRMIDSKEIDCHSLFWSDWRQQWIPLVYLLHDIYPERLDRMREAGVKRVGVTASRRESEEQSCDACRKLIGQIYLIDAVPDIPPDNCTCVPWSACSIGAIADDDFKSFVIE
jgi:hypothetical protein